ncbi:MAG TPA: hypothetical protein VKB30_08055 [Candidatus Limnocylindrales bacterium]|nr:hypothetical protein [Candidatus Limnocylindrales bacterium]
MAIETSSSGAPADDEPTDDEPTPAAPRLVGQREPSAAPTTPPAPPSIGDVAWFGAIATAKALVIALAADAFVNSNSPRYSGKGMRLRAIGYTGSLLIVPAAWRLLGRKDPYPRELDLAVTIPLLADAGGNAVGIYQRAHVDDAIHFANGALLTTVVGALVSPRTRTSWEAAGVATAVGTSAAAVWEIAEWIGLKLGARGMNLSYDDTMEDLIETAAGAVLGGVVTLLRHPVRLRQLPGRGSDELVAHS